MAVSRQVCPFHADEDIRGVLQAVAMARSLLHARERGAIRTVALTAGCMCRSRTSCPVSRAMRPNSAWRRNCLRLSRSTGDSRSNTVLRSERTRCSVLTISQPSWADTVTPRSGPRSTQHQPSLPVYSACSASREPCCTIWVPRPGAGGTTARSFGGEFRPLRTGSQPAYRGPTAPTICPTYQARQRPVAKP
jgi:hypothetical protein